MSREYIPALADWLLCVAGLVVAARIRAEHGLWALVLLTFAARWMAAHSWNGANEVNRNNTGPE
jgi:hypothetical protein